MKKKKLNIHNSTNTFCLHFNHTSKHIYIYIYIYIFWCWIKRKGVYGVASLTPCHVMTMSNTMYTTRALLGLSLELLLSGCWDRDSYYQATPRVVIQTYILIFINKQQTLNIYAHSNRNISISTTTNKFTW